MNGKYILEKSTSEIFNMSNKDAFDAMNDWRNDWDDSDGAALVKIHEEPKTKRIETTPYPTIVEDQLNITLG